MAALLLAGLGPAGAAGDSDALWKIVHQQCVPNQGRPSGPQPCALLDARRGYAILKDQRGVGQFLLIATARVAGIEDPSLWAPGAPPYWQHAWAARQRVGQRLGRRLNDAQLSLAVNSAYGRSQNQLHIHIDCLAPWVASALARQAAHIGERWAPLPQPLGGHAYLARRLRSLDGPQANPFQLVARQLGGAAMAGASILVAGDPGGGPSGGLILLVTQADLLQGWTGSAEQLQDHDCTGAR